MSVPSATAAASTRTRKESRSSNPKARGTMTPKQSQIEGLEEFQRKRRSSSKSSSQGCCLMCIMLYILVTVIIRDLSGSGSLPS